MKVGDKFSIPGSNGKELLKRFTDSLLTSRGEPVILTLGGGEYHLYGVLAPSHSRFTVELLVGPPSPDARVQGPFITLELVQGDDEYDEHSYDIWGVQVVAIG